jgi:hypothetical protein
MYQTALFLVCLSCLFSCKKERIPSVIHCLGQADALPDSMKCAPDGADSLYCNHRFWGQFSLVENSKLYQPLYCQPTGAHIRFLNDTGAFKDFTLLNKCYQERCQRIQSLLPCVGAAQYDLFYMQSEAIEIQLSSSDQQIELDIIIQPQPDLIHPENGGVGDFLHIYRKNNTGTWALESATILSKRSLSYPAAVYQEYFESIELLGVVFYEVISSDVHYYPAQSRPFKYYYNQLYGLIGFEEQNGALWRLDQE